MHQVDTLSLFLSLLRYEIILNIETAITFFILHQHLYPFGKSSVYCFILCEFAIGLQICIKAGDFQFFSLFILGNFSFLCKFVIQFQICIK